MLVGEGRRGQGGADSTDGTEGAESTESSTSTESTENSGGSGSRRGGRGRHSGVDSSANTAAFTSAITKSEVRPYWLNVAMNAPAGRCCT